MPVGVITSTHSNDEWKPREKDIKHYIHFDRAISPKKIQKIANDPVVVSRHFFFLYCVFMSSGQNLDLHKNQRKIKAVL